jgi:hypothetical protein
MRGWINKLVTHNPTRWLVSRSLWWVAWVLRRWSCRIWLRGCHWQPIIVYPLDPAFYSPDCSDVPKASRPDAPSAKKSKRGSRRPRKPDRD